METGNRGNVDVDGALRTAPNPQSRNGRSLLAKLVHAAGRHQRFKLTVEGNEDATSTDVRHLLGFNPRTGAVSTGMHADDHQTRARVSFDYQHDAVDSPIADSLRLKLYRQDSETTQLTDELRITADGQAERRHRVFNFDQRLVGGEFVAYKGFAIGDSAHALTWGLEATRTRVRQKRDGHALTLATGEVTHVVVPDVYPVHDFPRSRISNVALFAQDEIVLADGSLRLVPGVRVDRYALRPQHDPVYAEDNPDLQPADITETSIAPKLGAVWHFSDAWMLFAGYARGFRSPPYADVNLGFTNFQHGYMTVPNPDLQPETSDGFELGLRHIGPLLHASLAAFHNRYRDFIESGVLVSAPPQSPVLVFQSRNVAQARIEGLELKASLDLGGWSDSLQGWSLRGAAAWQRGEDERSGRTLATVDPARASLGIGYEAIDWSIGLHGRFARRKHELPEAGGFAPPGHGVLDLTGHWAFAPGAGLEVGVFNLGDRKYWDWADVGGLAAGDPALDRYTRPGRNVAVNLSFTW